jgi:hypothetical protein
MSGPTLEAEQTGLVLWPILAHIPFYLSPLNVLLCRPYLRYPAPSSTDDGLRPQSVRTVHRSFARPPLVGFPKCARMCRYVAVCCMAAWLHVKWSSA